jgi:hypothetical protein
MKTRKFNKKLVFKKETIANLDKKDMLKLQVGGYAAASAAPVGETTCADSFCPILTCTCKCDTVTA